MAKITKQNKTVETLVHEEAKRKNIPTAEHESVVRKDEKKPIRIKYPRNTDLDPQLVWRGKDEQDWSDLVVNAPPLYIQEKIHPKALIDDLLRQTKEEEHEAGMSTADLFSDFDGISKDVDKTEFYSHDQNWSNRMILGDSLQVMASLAEREGLRGQVQCIYFDPPYGIKFNSNFQWSTTSRDVKDGNLENITREPEQVKAFRDTWRDGIQSYLTYLRDRLTVARDLLSDSGSIFVQISDENVHRVRALLDEVFGDDNFVSEIVFRTTSGLGSNYIKGVYDHLLLYAKDKDKFKFRSLFQPKSFGGSSMFQYVKTEDGFSRRLEDSDFIDESKLKKGLRSYRLSDLVSSGLTPSCVYTVSYQGRLFESGRSRSWKTNKQGMDRLALAGRLAAPGRTLQYITYFDDFPVSEITNVWMDSVGELSKTYVVQTSSRIIERCLLMVTDPGDLILDPTCGSGTSAFVAEQWGRRWITIDTSRVALALARARIMGAKYPFYFLADSNDGHKKEAELSSISVTSKSATNNIKYGFVYDRVPHVTLKSIANNLELDEINNKWEKVLKELLDDFNSSTKLNIEVWQLPNLVNDSWNQETKDTYNNLLDAKTNRQKEIDLSINSKAEFEYLFDKPFEDKKKVRVAGPFTVESLSPHRALDVDENDNLIDLMREEKNIVPKQSFSQMILDNLKKSGVQQAHKEDKIEFSFLAVWPGNLVCAEGKYSEGGKEVKSEKRAAIFIGPEFGTVQRADLVQAAREAGDAGFDVLISCAFNYDAHATELNNLGSIPILKARMNADLHMSEDLKNTGKGNLFVIFGEPDIDILYESNEKIRVKVNGVDVFKPQTGEVISDGADGIACWFIDTDYNEESFFVRHAYFLGANDPYNSLKISLKSEINLEAWETLNSNISRAFFKPKSNRIAVKVINHLGDEVMKVFKV